MGPRSWARAAYLPRLLLWRLGYPSVQWPRRGRTQTAFCQFLLHLLSSSFQGGPSWVSPERCYLLALGCDTSGLLNVSRRTTNRPARMNSPNPACRSEWSLLNLMMSVSDRTGLDGSASRVRFTVSRISPTVNFDKLLCVYYPQQQPKNVHKILRYPELPWDCSSEGWTRGIG